MSEGPSRFGWMLENELAGSGRPGRSRPLAADLAFLEREGIEVILSLMETPMNVVEYREAGFEAHHFPVEDFGAPDPEQVVEACSVIGESLARGKRVLVHCNAGIGRTGTILACFLVHRGAAPDQAIRKVRERRPLSLETPEQSDLVHRYHRLRSRPAAGR